MTNVAENLTPRTGTEATTAHERPPELVDALPVPAQKAKGFSASVFKTDDRYADRDDASAYQLAEAWLIEHGLTAQTSHLSEVFPSETGMVEYLSRSPLGKVTTTDDISGKKREEPLLESKEAGTLRDRIIVSGLMPMFIADGGRVVMAVRVDENCQKNIARILSDDVATVLQELDRLNPGALDVSTSVALLPVSQTTYNNIQAYSLDAAQREQHFIRDCDEHFFKLANPEPKKEEKKEEKKEGAAAVEDGSSLKLDVPVAKLSQLYPNGDVVQSIIHGMHYDPFLTVEKKRPQAQSAEDAAARKDLLGDRELGESIFDPPVEQNVKHLLDKCAWQGFVPLKIERDPNNNPVLYIGFRAYEQGASGEPEIGADGRLKKVDCYDLNQNAEQFLMTLQSALKGHLPGEFSLSDMRLVPIPNAQYEEVSRHLSDPNRRKNTLNIIDRVNGVLNSQQLISRAVDEGAQEIYMNLDSLGPRVRFGIGADVVEAPMRYSTEAYVRTLQTLVQLMSNKSINWRLPLEGHIRFHGAKGSDFAKWEECFKQGETPPRIPGDDTQLNIYPRNLEGISLRLQYMPCEEGPQLVIRIHRMQKNPPLISELNLRPEAAAAIDKVLKVNTGLVLFVAPTGSGKSTLMAALLRAKNVPGRVIMTMEKPVEFRIPGVAQVSLNDAAGLTQDEVLNGFLRSAPHVIMVAEIRDRKEADVALRSGLSGHLVTSTLHTNDAPEAMVRLLNMELDPFFLSSAVTAVVSQRLIPQFTSVKHSLRFQPDPTLVERYDCRKDLEELIGRPGVFDAPRMGRRPRTGSGHGRNPCSGRVPVNEVIIPGPDLKKLLQQKRWMVSDLIEVLRKEENPVVPFEPMVVGALRWVLEGRTSLGALYEGEKVLPLEQFRTYADEIVKVVKEWQGRAVR